MRKRLEMSDLTPTDIAAHAHIEQHLKQGVWTSTTEMNAALRNPLYHMGGELGRLYQHEWEQKGIRTQATGVSLLPEGSRVSDIYPSTAQQAGAVRNADGSYDVGVIDVGAPDGRPISPADVPADESNGKYGDGVRVVNRPGGVTQVSVRSGAGLPLIVPSSVSER